MKTLGGAVLAIVVGITASQAFANDEQQLADVSNCMAKTGATGTFETREGKYGNFVVPTDGRQSAADRINDCLLDVRQVQFGANGVSGTSTVTESTTVPFGICKPGYASLRGGSGYCMFRG